MENQAPLNVFEDPEFKALAPAEQHKVLVEVDPDYANLPPKEQNKVILGLNPTVVEAGTPPESTALKRLLQSDDARVAGKFADEILKTTLPALGGVGGALVGTGTGNPYLTVAGGALGATIGNELYDALRGKNKVDTLYDEKGNRIFTGPRNMTLPELLGKAGSNLTLNTLTEGLGAVAPVAIKEAGKLLQLNRPTLTSESSKAVAGRRLDEMLSPSTRTLGSSEFSGASPEFTGMQNTASELESRIPGFRATPSMTGSAESVSRLRELESQSPANRDIYNLAMDRQQKLVRDFAEQNIGKAGNAAEAEAMLKNIDTTLKAEVEAAQPQNLPLGTDRFESGTNIVDALKKTSEPIKQQMSDLYSQVPRSAPLTPTNTMDALNAFKNDTTIPLTVRRDLINDVDHYLANMPKTPTVGDVDAVYRNFNTLANDLGKANKSESSMYAKKIKDAVDSDFAAFAEKASDPTNAVTINYNGVATSSSDLADALVQAKVDRSKAISTMKPQSVVDGLNQEIAAMEDALNTADPVVSAQASLGAARRFARDEFYSKFGTTDIKATLRPGQEASGLRLEAEQIPSRFNNVSGAKQLNNALGNKEAADLMRNSYYYELSSVSPTQYSNWVKKNAPALKEYGLYNEFSNVANQQSIYDTALKTRIDFEKSAVGKMLQVDDMGGFVKYILSNPTTAKENMSAVVTTIKNNPAAIDGMKASVRDHILNTIENASLSTAGDNVLSPAKMQQMMKSYRPAFEVLYSKAELQALDDVTSALNLLGNDRTRVTGGGSKTAQELSDAMSMFGTKLPSWLASALKFASNIGKGEQNRFMLEAYFDPKFAAELKNAAQRNNLDEWYSRYVKQYQPSVNATLREVGRRFMENTNIFSQPRND